MALEGLLCRASIPARSAAGLSAALEVLRERHRVALAGGLEPGASEAVAERTVGVGERGVCPLTYERVAEGVLGLAGEFALGLPRDEFAPGQRVELLADARCPAAERHHPALPERLAEDARGTQDHPRF